MDAHVSIEIVFKRASYEIAFPTEKKTPPPNQIIERFYFASRAFSTNATKKTTFATIIKYCSVRRRALKIESPL